MFVVFGYLNRLCHQRLYWLVLNLSAPNGASKEQMLFFVSILMKMSAPEKIRDHFVTIWNYGK
jgi:hypothetical protein